MLIHSNAKTATRWGVTLLAHPHLDPSGIQLMPVGHVLPGHPTPFGLPFFLWFSTPAGTRVPTSALHRHTSLLRDLSPPMTGPLLTTGCAHIHEDPISK